ncbi:MAG: hypothetical protein ABIG71_03560 [Candidatus Uhrbacteria bacterium]
MTAQGHRGKTKRRVVPWHKLSRVRDGRIISLIRASYGMNMRGKSGESEYVARVSIGIVPNRGPYVANATSTRDVPDAFDQALRRALQTIEPQLPGQALPESHDWLSAITVLGVRRRGGGVGATKAKAPPEWPGRRVIRHSDGNIALLMLLFERYDYELAERYQKHLQQYECVADPCEVLSLLAPPPVVESNTDAYSC